MRRVYVIGVGITQFARHPDRSIKSLTAEAVNAALKDANLKKEALQAAWFSNSAWGIFSYQHSIRGQVALRPMGISAIPIVNLENACAGGATAFHEAWMSVAGEFYDVVLAVGADKFYYPQDKEQQFRAIAMGVDQERRDEQFNQLRAVATDIPGMNISDTPDPDKGKSAFMDLYAGWARNHMKKFGTTQRQIAIISSKNHFHGTLNPYAQYRKEMSVEEVLADKLVAYPITRSMCAPIGDGSAAAILCSESYLRKLADARPVRILASEHGSGTDRPLEADDQDLAHRVGKQAYEAAGVGPKDINLAEVHDATAYGELHQTETLQFCKFGEGGPFAESGATKLGGKIPVNVSGGLESRGHPVGATGLGQIHELVTQLRGEAGDRQVKNARIGLAENGGGTINWEEAAMCIHILEKVK